MEPITTNHAMALNATSNGISMIDIALSDSPVFQRSLSINLSARRLPGSNVMNAASQKNKPGAFARCQMQIDTSPVSCTQAKRIVHRLNLLDILLPIPKWKPY